MTTLKSIQNVSDDLIACDVIASLPHEFDCKVMNIVVTLVVVFTIITGFLADDHPSVSCITEVGGEFFFRNQGSE